MTGRMNSQTVRRLLLLLISGRRLELVELTLLIWALPTLVSELELAGLGALVVADGVVTLTSSLVARAPAGRRPNALIGTAAAMVLAATAGLVSGASPQQLAVLCVAALCAWPRLRSQTWLRRATSGTTRIVRGGASLLRIGAALWLGQGGAVITVAASWVAIELLALGWLITSRAANVSPHFQAELSGDQRKNSALNDGGVEPASSRPTLLLWHLDPWLIAAIAGLAGVAPWAVGAWIVGRLMGLSDLLEQAALPLPVPRVPDGLAWQRSFDATVLGSVSLGVPTMIYAAPIARHWFAIDAPWLGLFGVVMVVAAVGRSAARGCWLASTQQPLDLPHLGGWQIILALLAVAIFGPPGAVLATIATLAGFAALRLRWLWPRLGTWSLSRLLALIGPFLGGLFVGAVLLAVKPPRSIQAAILEAVVTLIVTSTAAFATYQIRARG